MPAPLQLRMVGVMIGSPEMKLNMVKPQILLALIANLFPSKLPELTSFFFYLPNPQQPPPPPHLSGMLVWYSIDGGYFFRVGYNFPHYTVSLFHYTPNEGLQAASEIIIWH